MALSDETQKQCRELLHYFLVPFDIEDETKEIRSLIPRLPAGLAIVAETFTDRISATLETTATPYLLANQAAYDKHFQRISIAAKIRALKLCATQDETSNELEERRFKAAYSSLQENMSDFCASEEGVDAICLETARFLIDLHKTQKVKAVARELLLQGIFSTWSALEMLIGDGIVLLLNADPKLVTKLLSDPNAKKKFEFPKLNAEYLSSKGYDLSNQMGSLLFEERDLSNLATIRIACNAIFEDCDLRRMLNEEKLWLLNQNRHLIAHRRGVVDNEYIRNTGSKLTAGSQLNLSPDDFENNLKNILLIGKQFLINGLSTGTLARPFD